MLIIRYFIVLLENRLELFQTSAGLIKSLTFTSTGLKSISVRSCKGESMSCLQNVFHKSEKRSPNTDRICLPVSYPKQPSQTPCVLYLTDINQTFTCITYPYGRTAVTQWLRCCVTNRKVDGSIPDGSIGILH